jgi:hypothetical protein
MSGPDADPKPAGAAMDTPGARQIIPAAQQRLRGADRSGLGEAGWAEVSDHGIGHPDDSNVPAEYYQPASERDPLDPPV